MGAEEESGDTEISREWGSEDSQYLLAMIVCSICWLSIDSKDPVMMKYVASSLMGLIIILMVRDKSRSTIPGLFLFGLCLRLYFQSFSGFEKVPWSDAIIDVFVSRSLLEYEEITVFSMASFTSRLEFYSSWPIVHIFIASVSAITGSKVTIAAHISQAIIYLATFLLSFAVIDIFRRKFSLSENEVVFAVALLITLPELVYWQSEAVRQNFGILFHVFVVFLLLAMDEKKFRIELSVLLIIGTLFLSITHHLTSASSVLLIFTVLVLRILLVRMHNEDYQGNDIRHIMNCFFMVSIMTILWWSLVGGILYPVVESVLERYIMIINGARFTDSLHDPVAVDIPKVLTPVMSIIVIRIRDLLLFGITALGFILLFREKRSRLEEIVAYVPFVLSYGFLFIFFFLWAEPFRVVTLAAPFMAVSFGFGIGKISEKVPQIGGIALMILIIGSLLSPWAHNYAPTHLYDEDAKQSSNLFGETGFYTTEYLDFLFSHTSENSTIESDFPEELLYYADANALDKLEVVRVSEDSDNGTISYSPKSDIVVLLRDGTLYSYYSSIYGRVDGFQEGVLWQDEISKSLLTHDKVYDAGEGVSFWLNNDNGA